MISAVVNFKKNLSKDPTYCQKAAEKTLKSYHRLEICEHAILCADSASAVLSRICEGYQFIIAFSGLLTDSDSLFDELASFGYHFCDKSDAELALFAYIHFGEHSSELISGSFSYIIYDSMRRRIFAATDENASKPLFYAPLPAGAVICSTLLGITPFSDTVTISPKIAENVLENLSLSAEELFDGIFALPPSSFLKISPSGFEKGVYAPKSSQTEKYISDLSKTTEKVSLLCTGGESDRKNLELLSEFGITPDVYFFNAPAPHSVPSHKIDISVSSAQSALRSFVELSGTPCTATPLSLFLSLENIAPGGLILAPRPTCILASLRRELSKNGIPHPAIDTISDRKTAVFSINIAGLLAEKYDTQIVFSAPEENDSLDFAKDALKRLLLFTISKDTAPILAFFHQKALLRLCEERFPAGEIPLCELFAYLIKLNMWFETYRPKIL